MTANLSAFAGAGWQFFNDNGVPLTGGLLYTYIAGTVTPLVTYTSSSGLVANPNPVVLNAAGRVPGEIWLTAGASYKFVLKTSDGVEIATLDDISGVNDFSQSAANYANSSDPSKGDALIGFRQSNSLGNISNTFARTVHTKLQDLITAQDFGAVGDGTTDNASFLAAAGANGPFVLPAGVYRVSSNTTITNKITFLEGAVLSPDTGVTITLAPNQGQILVSWFGAKGDGVTDDTTPIQNAINAAYDIYLPSTESGYLMAGNGTGQRWQIPANRRISGDFFKTKIIHSNNEWLFEIRGSFVGVSQLQIDASAAVTPGRGQFFIRSDMGSYERIWLKEIETTQSFQFLRDSKNGVNLLVNLQLEDVICRRHRGIGIDLEDCFAYGRFTNVTVDYVNSVSKNHTAYRMIKNAGSVWTNVDVTGGQVDGTTVNQHGFLFDNCIAVWMNNCIVDTVGGHGFYFFSDCRSFYLSQCVSSLNGYAGFNMTGTGNSNNMFANCNCIGRQSSIFSYKVASQSGWFILNATGTQLTGCKSIENTGSGVYMENSTLSVVTGCQLSANARWGIETVGTTSGIYSSCGINQPASLGNASLATAIDHLVNSQLTSGVIGNLTGPGTI